MMFFILKSLLILLLKEVFTRFVQISNSEGAGSPEHHQVQQGVSTQPVSTMNAGTSCLTAGIQAGYHLVLPIGMINHLVSRKYLICFLGIC